MLTFIACIIGFAVIGFAAVFLVVMGLAGTLITAVCVTMLRILGALIPGKRQRP